MNRLILIAALLLFSAGCKKSLMVSSGETLKTGDDRTANEAADATPPPKLTLSGVQNSTINFGTKPVNSNTGVSFQIKNEGDSIATFLGNPVLASPWKAETNCGILAPDSSCMVTVYFNPKTMAVFAPGAYYARFLTEWGAEFRTSAITLQGTGASPGNLVNMSAAVVNYGAKPSGSNNYSTITLKNTGGSPVKVNSYSLAAPFSITSENCSQSPLGPQGTCLINVNFSGSGVGAQPASQLVAGYHNGVSDTNVGLTTFQGFLKHPKILTSVGVTGNTHTKGFNTLLNYAVTNSFSAYGGFQGGVSISGTMDFDGDGIGDFVTGAEAGGAAHVKRWNHANGETAGIIAYENFGGGVNIGGCDNAPYFITGPGPGGWAHVRIWNLGSMGLVSEWDAFPGFLGGISVGCAVNPATGQPLFVVGARAGATPHVKVFDINGALLASFYAYDAGFSGGVNVALGDLNNDNQLEIIVTPHTGVRNARVFNLSGGVLKEWAPYGGFGGGAFVAVGDVNGDGVRDIITGANAGGGASVVGWRYSDLVAISAFDAYPGYSGGVRVGFTY